MAQVTTTEANYTALTMKELSKKHPNKLADADHLVDAQAHYAEAAVES